MIFNDEINYSGPPVGYVDAVWKQQGFSNPAAMNDIVGHYDGKLRNKWCPDYNSGNPMKSGQHEPVPSPFYAQNQFWNDQSAPYHSVQHIDLHEQARFMGGAGAYNVGGNVQITGSTDMGTQQWGRSEINQTTPWETTVDCSNQQRYRGHQDNANGSAGVMQQHPNAMVNRNMGMPMMGQRITNNGQWMDGVNKMGDHSTGRSATTNQSAMFMTPPPPLGMVAPHRQLIGPPPPIPAMHHTPMHQPFSITTFSIPSNQIQQSTMGMASMHINEDSMWQDPNGDLRKWQRDTGTSIWGDPTKQNGPIQRWQQFTADEVAASSSTRTIKGESENGWGELPPLTNNGRSANASQYSNTFNEAPNRAVSNGVGSNVGNNGWSTAEHQSVPSVNGNNGWNDHHHQYNQPVSSINGANNFKTTPSFPPATLFQSNSTEIITIVDANTPTTVTSSLPNIPVTNTSVQNTDDKRQSPIMKVSLAEELSSITSINGIGSIRQSGNDVGSLW